MPIVSFNNVGKVGIVPDINPVELPPEAWSNGQNVRFIDGKAEKFSGHSAVFDPPAIAPYWLLPVSTASAYYWIYAGLNKVYVTDGANHFNLTRQSAGVDVDYAATADQNWNGGIIGGVPILNNGLDDPQMWTPVNTGTRLQSLTYASASTWASVNYTAKVIRPFGQRLIALDVTKAGTQYPTLVKWSHPADPGMVPQSWDHTDTTKTAGEYDLTEGGALVDCLPLKDTNILYGPGATWGMQLIGGNNVFRFYKLFSDSGIVSRRCVQTFQGRHLVFTPGDLVIHDGQRVESIVDNRTRRWLTNNVDETHYGRSFIAPNYLNDEMWVCFPAVGASLPSRALVWNYRDGTFGVRELPDTPHIGFGVVDPSESQVWNDDAGAWDDDAEVWNKRAYNPVAQTNLICDPTRIKLYRVDDTNQFAGANMTAYLERTGLHTFAVGNQALGGMDRIKTVTEVWPRLEGTGSVRIYVGSQMSTGDPINWSPARTFTIGSDKKADVNVSGRFIAVRFESTGDSSWKLTGYDMRVNVGGRR
jgi:hypothetical protein